MFHSFLYGKQFQWKTDNKLKLLESIIAKGQQESTLGLHSLVMRTLLYDFTLKYIKAMTNQLADCLSRLGLGSTQLDGHRLPIVQVQEITCKLQATNSKIVWCKEATGCDNEL